jgi:hypothetical protein
MHSGKLFHVTERSWNLIGTAQSQQIVDTRTGRPGWLEWLRLKPHGHRFGAQTSSFGEFLKVWLKIGCINFGGPAGQIAMMHRIVVDEKKWIEESRFLHALNFCMLLPGRRRRSLRPISAGCCMACAAGWCPASCSCCRAPS